MRIFLKKLRLLFLPLVLIAVSLLVVYTFFNWLLLTFMGPAFEKMMADILLPVGLAGIGVVCWLRPRMKRFRFTRNQEKSPFLYACLANYVIAIPVILTQMYLKSDTGKLTTLHTIGNIDKHPPTMYYSLDRCYIDKEHASMFVNFQESGKRGEYLDFELFVTLPVFEKPMDTSAAICPAWYGLRFTRQVNNRLENTEKLKKYEEFLVKSKASFEAMDVNNFSYLVIPSGREAAFFQQAVSVNNRFESANCNILLPKKGTFADRNDAILSGIICSIVIGWAAWLLLILWPSIKEIPEPKAGRKPEPMPKPVLPELRSFFIPRRYYYVTPILLSINLAIWIILAFIGVDMFFPHPLILSVFGANERSLTMDGQWWRLLTSLFVHGGFFQLCGNFVGLVTTGVFLEPFMGRWRYLLFYLLAGILAGIASIVWHPETVSSGASGAIFGLYGLAFAFLFGQVFPAKSNALMAIGIFFFVLFHLVIAWVAHQDTAAHIGGLVGGFVLGFLFLPYAQRSAQQHLPEDRKFAEF